MLFPFRRAFVLTAVCFTLAACATSRTLPSSEAETWGFYGASHQEPARLLYGLDETDLVSLGFTCVPGSGVATTMVFVGEDESEWPGRLVLQSGEASQSLDIALSDAGDMPILEAQLDAANPVAKAFALTGRLTSTLFDNPRRVDARSGRHRREVQAFWRECAKRP